MQLKNTVAALAVPAVFVCGMISFHKKDTLKIQQNSDHFSMISSVFAAPSTNCASILTTTLQAYTALGTTYTNHYLTFAHTLLFEMNHLETADTELAFCNFVNTMGMNPSLTTFPQTITQTFNSHTVVLMVTSPTETFATTKGYTAKGVVTYDGTTFLTVWWTGNGTTSKGYLIEGSMPLVGDPMTRLKYILWDRSTTPQVIKIFSTQFQTASTYLTNPTIPTGSLSGADRTVFARSTYNAGTNAITGQMVAINVPVPGGPFKCHKAMFNGALGGTIDLYLPAGTLVLGVRKSALGEATTTTTKDATGMVSITGISDTTTTADVNDGANTSPTLPTPFDYSCADLTNSTQAGHPFASSTVNYSADPATIFPN